MVRWTLPTPIQQNQTALRKTPLQAALPLQLSHQLRQSVPNQAPLMHLILNQDSCPLLWSPSWPSSPFQEHFCLSCSAFWSKSNVLARNRTGTRCLRQQNRKQLRTVLKRARPSGEPVSRRRNQQNHWRCPWLISFQATTRHRVTARKLLLDRVCQLNRRRRTAMEVLPVLSNGTRLRVLSKSIIQKVMTYAINNYEFV